MVRQEHSIKIQKKSLHTDLQEHVPVHSKNSLSSQMPFTINPWSKGKNITVWPDLIRQSGVFAHFHIFPYIFDHSVH